MNCCRVDVLSPVYESEVNEPLVFDPKHPEKAVVGDITYLTAGLKEDDLDETSGSDEEIFFSASTQQYFDGEAETEEIVNSKLGCNIRGCGEVKNEAEVSGSHLFYKTDIYDYCKPGVFLDLIHFYSRFGMIADQDLPILVLKNLVDRSGLQSACSLSSLLNLVEYPLLHVHIVC